MRALCGRPGGGVEGSAIQEIPTPEPGAGEVRVRVEAAAVNPADLKVLAWKDGGAFLHSKHTPLVVGYDFSGSVDAVGAGVTDRRVGDAVLGFVPYARSTVWGSFAEFVTVRSDTVALRPAGLSAARAAALATGGSTALQALRDKGRLTLGGSGGRVLVNGASGGVGLIAVQIAKAMGAEVWGTSSAAKMDAVRAAGADHAVDYRVTALSSIREGFDVVLDAASTSSYGECSGILGPKGAYVTLLPSGSLVTGKLAALFSSRRCEFVTVKPLAADLAWLAGQAAAGALDVRIEASYPFDQIKEALTRFQTGAGAGKVVVEWAPRSG